MTSTLDRPPPTAPPVPGSDSFTAQWLSEGPPGYGSRVAQESDQVYPSPYRTRTESARRILNAAANRVEEMFLSHDQISDDYRAGTLAATPAYNQLASGDVEEFPRPSRGRETLRRRAGEFIDTITMRNRRVQSNETPSRQEVMETLPTFWPICTMAITLVQIAMFIAVCIAFGLAPIAFEPQLESETVRGFNGISRQETREIAPNFFIGPNTESLVHVGAQFTPCMRENVEFLVQAAIGRNQEQNLRCCLTPLGECGMIPLDQCLAIELSSIEGGASVCQNQSVNPTICTQNVTLHPCCTGLLGNCSLTTSDNCTFLGGHYHPDKAACSELGGGCFDSICNFTWTPFLIDAQGIRFFTAIFLHRGVVDLLIVIIFQLYIGWRIERRIGWLRLILIYIISGIGGFLFSGLFDAASVSVGATGPLFGLLGVLLVELLQSWKWVRRPLLELVKLLILDIVLILLGTLPYIDNFANIGGFICGILASFVFVPYITLGKWDKVKKLCLILTALPIMALLFLIGFVFFYNWPYPNFCPECSYINCIPYTPTFCKDFIGTLREFIPVIPVLP